MIPLNIYEKCFLFNLKTSFCSQDIKILVLRSSCKEFFPVDHSLAKIQDKSLSSKHHQLSIKRLNSIFCLIS